MVVFQKSNTSNDIILTLTEKVTIENPYYLFVFENRTTKGKVKFVKSSTDDLSSYPERFNEFTVARALFTEIGKYVYRVYEQDNESNTDETGLNLLENGQAEFIDVPAETYTEYSSETTYKVYGG